MPETVTAQAQAWATRLTPDGSLHQRHADAVIPGWLVRSVPAPQRRRACWPDLLPRLRESGIFTGCACGNWRLLAARLTVPLASPKGAVMLAARITKLQARALPGRTDHLTQSSTPGLGAATTRHSGSDEQSIREPRAASFVTTANGVSIRRVSLSAGQGRLRHGTSVPSGYPRLVAKSETKSRLRSLREMAGGMRWLLPRPCGLPAQFQENLEIGAAETIRWSMRRTR